MLCNLLPNGNANAKAKSSSAWLDRLHTRNQNQNQNHEAQAQSQSASPSSSPSPTATATATPTPTPTPSDSNSMGDVMSSILADLFVMGNGNQSLRLQSSKPTARPRGLRKQPSPKICILSPTSAAPTPPSPTSPTSPHLNLNLKKKKKLKTKTNPLTLPVSNFKTQNKNQKKNIKKKKKRLSQPHGRTEATVIDTSTPTWKSPKILIRKGPTFWKILDKKQWNAALTKRKQKHLFHSHKSSHPSDQGDSHEESIDVMQGPVKRPKCCKLPSIPEAAKSIALHLKVRTKGKKKGPSYNNSRKEKVQP